MVFHGLKFYVQVGRNLLIALSFVDQGHNFELSTGQTDPIQGLT
jgi:hypothetical protein